MLGRKKTFIFYIAFFFCLLSFSQNLTKDVQPLSKILQSAKKQYGVTFTYANKIIDSITLPSYNKNLTLNEFVAYLKGNTPLIYSFISSKDILISKKLIKTTVCGYLYDSNTHTYINNATIHVLNSSLNEISNKDGYFNLGILNSNQVIEISHIAYPKIYLNSTDFISKKECLTISLSQKIETLSEVILQNYLTTGITLKTDNSITIDLLNSGILPGLIEPDILQKIQSLPGVSSANETISNINIRGGTNDQNLLLWDGIKMYHSGHFFGLISAFNPYLADKVTIIKNGTSSEFNDGVSGTIDIKSINNVKNKPFGGAGFNLLSGDFYAQVPLSKKTAIQFSARRSFTDLLNTPTFQQYFKKAFQDSKITSSITINDQNTKKTSDFKFSDYSFKLLCDFNKNQKLRISFINVDNKLHFKESIKTTTSFNSKTSELEQNNKALGIYFERKWNPKFKTSIQTYFTKYNVLGENFSILNDQRLIQINEVLETGIKLKTYYNFSKNLQLLTGYHFYELGITNKEDVNLPVYIKTVKNVIKNHSLFSQLHYVSKNNRTFINTGLRLNYIQEYNLFLAQPRFQMLQKLNSNFSFKMAGEFKSQNATQIIDLQEDFLGVENNRWVLSNTTTIPVIKSKQASVGFNYKRNGLFIDLEGFYKKISGITTSNQGFQNQHQFIKTSGSYNIKGLEIMINKKTSSFSSWIGYTYNDNNYNFPELSPSVFPNNLDIKHQITLGNTYTYKKFNFALGLLWRTGKPTTSPINNNAITSNGINTYINYKNPNNERLPNYFRADFSTTYNFKLGNKTNGLLGISVLNILKTKNILNKYYKINTNNQIDEIANTSIGTTPNITFRISF